MSLTPALLAGSLPAERAARADALDLARDAHDALDILSTALHEAHRNHNKITNDYQVAEVHLNAAWRCVGYVRQALAGKDAQ